MKGIGTEAEEREVQTPVVSEEAIPYGHHEGALSVGVGVPRLWSTLTDRDRRD